LNNLHDVVGSEGVAPAIELERQDVDDDASAFVCRLPPYQFA
jgi:hypothetical protein